MNTGLLRIGLVVILLPLLALVSPADSVPANRSRVGPRVEHAAAANTCHDIAASFVENVGQFPMGVRFQLLGGKHTFWLTEDAIWMTLTESSETTTSHRAAALKLTFQGANPHPRLEGIERLATSANYFYGDDPAAWHTNVPVWGGVRYANLYPGIDLEWHRGHREPQWVIRPDADAHMARLRVEGAEGVELAGEGTFRVRTAAGAYALPLWPAVDERGTPWVLSASLSPHVEGKHEARAYEITHPFAPVAPPPTTATQPVPGLRYATLLGGTSDDWGLGIAVDAQGAAYVTGLTASPDFPTTPGAFETRHQGSRDAFVVKLHPSGTTLEYATFLGGRNKDWGSAIAVDANGAAYVTGRTESPDFPTTSGAFERRYQGGWDVFIAKLEPGGALVYATYLGGSRYDRSFAIALDDAGAAYVTGSTYSPDFPTTPDTFDRDIGEGTCEGEQCLDAFVVKMNPNGSDLVYATFLGGSDYDYGSAVVIDADGAAYVAGETHSPDFPTTNEAFDREIDGASDAFIVKLNPDGTTLEYATLLGGNDREGGFALALGGDGALYVAGPTYSSDFPATRGAFAIDYQGAGDAFVVKLNPGGSALAYATFLGGSDYDYASAIAIDADGAAYVTGRTWSSIFPTTYGALDRTLGGQSDAFIAKLDARGAAMEYATFLGGDGYDYASAMAIDAARAVYVTGLTSSPDFPTTRGAFGKIPGEGRCEHEPCLDAFVAKLAW
ncbi:MAG: SBBP repeat-containing protein [Anaerolineae bacterium]